MLYFNTYMCCFNSHFQVNIMD